MEEELIEGKNAKYCLDKNCEKNGQLQPFEAYCAQARGKYGYASACRNCVNRKRNEARQKRREEYHSTNGLTHKLCQGPVCIKENPKGVNIPVSDFGTDKKEVDGLYYICRKCKKARDQEYYEEKKKKRLFKLAEETKNDNIIDENCEEDQQDVSMQICRGILCKGKVKKPLSEFHKKCNRCKICRKAESKKKPKVASKKFGTKLCKGELCRKVNPLGIMKDVSEFATNTGNHDGLQSQCKDCKHDAMAKHYTEKDKVIKKIYDNTKKGQQKRAKTLEFSITLEDILSKLEEQNGKCALSGTDLTYIAYGKKGEIHYLNEDNMSIDRIDSNKGYIKENIQLVTARINRIKSDLGNVEFELFCKATLTWHDKKKGHRVTKDAR